MAKVQIKSEQVTPFGGIYPIMEQFDALLSNVIDSTLGLRIKTCHPKLRTCSADTILRAIKELSVRNMTYTSSVSGKSYDFNRADTMNELLVESLVSTGVF